MVDVGVVEVVDVVVDVGVVEVVLVVVVLVVVGVVCAGAVVVSVVVGVVVVGVGLVVVVVVGAGAPLVVEVVDVSWLTTWPLLGRSDSISCWMALTCEAISSGEPLAPSEGSALSWSRSVRSFPRS